MAIIKKLARAVLSWHLPVMPAILSAFLFAPAWAQAKEPILPKCLYISSYHKGYDWSDGVEEGLRSVLDGKCQIRQFDMNTKRRKSHTDKVEAAGTARKIISQWKPDVVITSDDNAAKYIITPHYKHSDLPFVFSGINWTVEEYGFPFSNVTGIVEVAPINAMLNKAIHFTDATNAVYIGADTLTEKKNYARIKNSADDLQLPLSKNLVSTFEQWLAAINEAQSADIIVMGSNSGISGWSDELATRHMQDNAETLSVTNHAWMMNVTSLGFTKIPQEHGEWAAEAALAILDGSKPTDIPIVKNRKWELWINSILVEKTGINLPANFSRKAKRLASVD